MNRYSRFVPQARSLSSTSASQRAATSLSRRSACARLDPKRVTWRRWPSCPGSSRVPALGPFRAPGNRSCRRCRPAAAAFPCGSLESDCGRGRPPPPEWGLLEAVCELLYRLTSGLGRALGVCGRASAPVSRRLVGRGWRPPAPLEIEIAGADGHSGGVRKGWTGPVHLEDALIAAGERRLARGWGNSGSGYAGGRHLVARPPCLASTAGAGDGSGVGEHDHGDASPFVRCQSLAEQDGAGQRS